MTNEEILRIIDGARPLIEAGWTQGAYARDAVGDIAYFSGREATCYCIVGALLRAQAAPMGKGDVSVVVDQIHLRGFPRWTRPSAIHVWNDAPTRTKEDVLAVLDRTAEALRSDTLLDEHDTAPVRTYWPEPAK